MNIWLTCCHWTRGKDPEQSKIPMKEGGKNGAQIYPNPLNIKKKEEEEDSPLGL